MLNRRFDPRNGMWRTVRRGRQSRNPQNGRPMKITHRPFKTIRHKKDYTSKFMTPQHEPIETFELAFKHKYSYNELYLFYKGEYIGEASYNLISKKRKAIHTDGVSLVHKHRKKGHGLHLYFHLIETARKLGVKRIYSSENLNENSRPMWDKKLPLHYDVKRIYQRGPCSNCGCTCKKRVKKFYIDLE